MKHIPARHAVHVVLSNPILEETRLSLVQIEIADIQEIETQVPHAISCFAILPSRLFNLKYEVRNYTSTKLTSRNGSLDIIKRVLGAWSHLSFPVSHGA